MSSLSWRHRRFPVSLNMGNYLSASRVLPALPDERIHARMPPSQPQSSLDTGIRLAVVALSLAHAMSHEVPCARNQSMAPPGRKGVAAGKLNLGKPITSFFHRFLAQFPSFSVGFVRECPRHRSEKREMAFRSSEASTQKTPDWTSEPLQPHLEHRSGKSPSSGGSAS